MGTENKDLVRVRLIRKKVFQQYYIFNDSHWGPFLGKGVRSSYVYYHPHNSSSSLTFRLECHRWTCHVFKQS